MSLHPPRNPFAKDAEAAGKYVVSILRPRSKRDRTVAAYWTDDGIAWLARWAGHWGNLALSLEKHES